MVAKHILPFFLLMFVLFSGLIDDIKESSQVAESVSGSKTFFFFLI